MKKTAIVTVLLLLVPLVFVTGCGRTGLQRELLAAAEEGDAKRVESLLDQGADVNARDKDDATPLRAAVIYGHTETARLLIERGADIEARCRNGQTPLHFAAVLGRTKVAELLGR